MRMRGWLGGVLAAALAVCVVAKKQEAFINTNHKFFFLSKFCFREEPTAGHSGFYELEVLGTPANAHLKLAVYNDESFSWPATYSGDSHRHCADITKVQPDGPALAVFNASELHHNAFREYVDAKDHPRFWYVAAFDCDHGVESLRYRVVFRQDADSLHREFSFEERDVFALYLVFFLLFLALSGAHLRGFIPTYRARALHPITNLVATIVGLEVVSLLLFTIHFGVYAADGVGSPGTKVLAGVLDVCAQVLVIGLMILVSKGWTITRRDVRDRRTLLVVLTLFVFQYFALFVWDVAKRDRADTHGLYETIPGVVILAVRLLLMLWALGSLFGTFREEGDPTKRRFYREFGLTCATFFLALPLGALISTALHAWNRFVFVAGVYLAANLVCTALLVWFFWPSRAAHLFGLTNPRVLQALEPYEDL